MELVSLMGHIMLDDRIVMCLIVAQSRIMCCVPLMVTVTGPIPVTDRLMWFIVVICHWDDVVGVAGFVVHVGSGTTVIDGVAWCLTRKSIDMSTCCYYCMVAMSI